MIRVHKENPKDYSEIYFASDFHWNHKQPFLYEKRGFENSQDHADFIKKSVLNLPVDALLVFLGDFALNTSFEEGEKFLRDFPCKTIMLWGNHNSIIKQVYGAAMGSEDQIEEYPLQLFVDRNIFMMGCELTLRLGKKTFFCRHMAPYIWDNMKHGVPALVGHSHGNCPPLNPDNDDLGKILDVGVENAMKINGTPFLSLKEVEGILAKKRIKIWDHHGE